MAQGEQTTSTAWILLSGGVDSTACLDLCLRGTAAVEAVHVDYQQRAAAAERKAAEAIAGRLGVPLSVLRYSGLGEVGVGEIVGRNAFLVSAVLMHAGHRHGQIVIGISQHSPYYDCSEAFLKLIDRIVGEYTDGQVQVQAPVLSWNKREIWEYCLDRQIPLELTYSCERAGPEPCEDCASCKERGLIGAG